MKTAPKASILTIPPRFCGPDGTGNGGYVSGLVAQAIDGCAEVTLRMPPPLDTPLTLQWVAPEAVVLRDGDRLVAKARPASVSAQAPPAVDLTDAEPAAIDPDSLRDHPYPNCFVCGPARPDGLRIFPGHLEGGLVAAPWTPGHQLADGNGRTARQFVWAALDCPGGWALTTIADPGTVALLGKFTAAIHELPKPPASATWIASR